MVIALHHPCGQPKLFHACEACGGLRSYLSARLCRGCYLAKSRANKVKKTHLRFWSALRANGRKHCARLRDVKRAETRRLDYLKREWEKILAGDKAWIATQRKRARKWRLELIESLRRARAERQIRNKEIALAQFKAAIQKRSQARQKRIRELSDRFEATIAKANLRSRREHEKETRRSLRRIDSEARRALANTYSLDASFENSVLNWHSFEADSSALPADEILMRKEEAEEERKFRVYRERKHRPIPIFQPHDFKEERLAALISSIPQRGRRGKRSGRITKYSPERGITQRHIKMSSNQFV